MVEIHGMGLFSDDAVRAAVDKAGFEVAYDADGLMKRGLYVGVRRG